MNGIGPLGRREAAPPSARPSWPRTRYPFERPKSKQRILWEIVLPIAGFALFGLVTANPFMTVATLLVLGIACALLWRPGEPPTLLYLFFWLWLTVAAKVLYADWQGVSARVGAMEPTTVETAIWLSLLSFFCFALGLRLGVGRPRVGLADVEDAARRLDPTRVALATIVVMIAAQILQTVAFRIPPLQQVLTALVNLQWVPFMILVAVVTIQRRAVIWLVSIIAAQIVIGFGGFFSDFKTVIFVALIAALGIQPRFLFRRPLLSVLIVVGTLGLGLIWTAIKPNYREFLNAGTGQQVVQRTVGERAAAFAGLVTSLDRRTFETAVADLIRRIEYVDYFSVVLTHVPRREPYTQGDLLLQAVGHVLKPRFLFPNKAALSDSDTTSRFTGLEVASAEQGTSVNIGLPGEGYIEFGPVGPAILMGLFGLILGAAFRWFAADRRNGPLVGMAMGSAVCFGISGAGTIVKFVGAIMMVVIVAELVRRFALPRILPLLGKSDPDGAGRRPARLRFGMKSEIR